MQINQLPWLNQEPTPNSEPLIATLGTIVKEAEAKQIKPPSVIVIGEVANLGRKLAWFKKPLA